MSFQCVIEPGHTAVYVPVRPLIQELFKHTDVDDELQEACCSQHSHCAGHPDGLCSQENELLSTSHDLKVTLILYTDETEISDPLGTSRKIHRL